ncbi:MULTISPECIES: hypothetical protein [unclassified Bartonella]|uniref:hypothetical protein n=1 Tax=unclassified Bartonella TaxID=2645622 RepID=UPI0035CF0D2B
MCNGAGLLFHKCKNDSARAVGAAIIHGRCCEMVLGALRDVFLRKPVNGNPSVFRLGHFVLREGGGEFKKTCDK